jgi:hypothetical protein
VKEENGGGGGGDFGGGVAAAAACYRLLSRVLFGVCVVLSSGFEKARVIVKRML